MQHTTYIVQVLLRQHPVTTCEIFPCVYLVFATSFSNDRHASLVLNKFVHMPFELRRETERGFRYHIEILASERRVEDRVIFASFYIKRIDVE